MKKIIKRKAFTLIEIVMVIVVLGIVAMIGTDIIAHMYEGYIKSKVVSKLQTRTDQVLNIIAKRLSYHIKDSAVNYKNPHNFGGFVKQEYLTQKLDIVQLNDIGFEKRLKEFCTSLVDDEFFDEYIWQKQDFLEENIDLIESCREKEIEIMHPEFWEDESEFHLLRYQFVYKVCQSNTPERLKWYNC